MSKLVQEPIEMIFDAAGQPAAICHNGVRLAVLSLLERWYYAGCWWNGETPQLFFRLQLEAGRVWEVFGSEAPAGTWKLYKIYD
ncbi:MAG: hypothetical protein ACM3QZ_05345 [Solirubrobacterales bacterium]